MSMAVVACIGIYRNLEANESVLCENSTMMIVEVYLDPEAHYLLNLTNYVL